MIDFEQLFSMKPRESQPLLRSLHAEYNSRMARWATLAKSVRPARLEAALSSGKPLLRVTLPDTRFNFLRLDTDWIVFMRGTFIAGLSTPANWGGYTPMSCDGFWVRYYCQGGRTNPDLTVPIREVFFSLQMKAGIERARQLPERERLYVMPGGGQNGFYHLLMDTLPGLRFYSDLKLDCPILLPRFAVPLQPIADEAMGIAMDSFSIPRSRLISAGEAADYRWRWGILPNQRYVNSTTVKFHREHLMPGARGEGVGERIYVSRQNVKLRSIVNEADIIDTVRRHGFVVLDMDSMTFAEQMGAFRSARRIIAPHGAGMSHMMYAPPGCSVTEIVQEKPQPFFKSLAKLCGHGFNRIHAPVISGRPGKYEFRDFEGLQRYCN